MSASLPSVRYSGYSAQVRLHLVMDGHSYPLAQMGPTSCILRESTSLPAGDAELICDIDGTIRTWPIRLPRAIDTSTTRVEYEDR